MITVIICFITFQAVSSETPVDNMIKIKINDEIFDLELENNPSTQELLKTLKKGNITVNASEYGGFEKVGALGFSLPTSDENIQTSPGDIVLYQGNQISIFYASHSWSYTRIGKVHNITSNQLKEVLGAGDATLIFFLE